MSAYTENNPLNRLGATGNKPKSQNTTQDPPKNEEAQDLTPTPKPKKVKRTDLTKQGEVRKSNAGRYVVKDDKDWHTTNVSLRREYYDFFLSNKNAMGGTLTVYLNKLIERDLAANKKKYEEITSMIGF